MLRFIAQFRRFLVTSLLIVSLLLTLAFAAGTFLPISIGPYPSGYRDRSVATFFVSSLNNHTFELYFLSHPLVPRTPGLGGIHDAGQDIGFESIFYHFGIAYEHADYIDNFANLVTIRGHDFTIPDWMPALFFLASTLLLALPQIRRRFRRLHADLQAKPCLKCHYDLRAHLTGGKCPECGTPIPAIAPSSKPHTPTSGPT